MKKFVKVMKALSDPNRVKVVKMLQARDGRCVCELVEALGLAQPTVSKHLKVLEEAGLVTGRREGPWTNYHLDGSDGAPYAPAMLELLQGWLGDDADVDMVLQHIDSIHRDTICNSVPKPRSPS